MASVTGQLATQMQDGDLHKVSSFPWVLSLATSQPSVATTAAGARFANDFSSASANCRARCALDEGSASPGEIASACKRTQRTGQARQCMEHVNICRKTLKHFFKQRFMQLDQGVDKTIAIRLVNSGSEVMCQIQHPCQSQPSFSNFLGDIIRYIVTYNMLSDARMGPVSACNSRPLAGGQ